MLWGRRLCRRKHGLRVGFVVHGSRISIVDFPAAYSLVHYLWPFRTSAMTSIRMVGWAVAAVMVAAIVYGFASGDFGAEASAIWGLPWGKVSLIDLYAGLVIFGGWIALRESSPFRIVLWWAALAVLGNLGAGIYLVRATMTATNTTELLTGNVERNSSDRPASA